jgi:hypothetical protein
MMMLLDFWRAGKTALGRESIVLGKKIRETSGRERMMINAEIFPSIPFNDG